MPNGTPTAAEIGAAQQEPARLAEHRQPQTAPPAPAEQIPPPPTPTTESERAHLVSEQAKQYHAIESGRNAPLTLDKQTRETTSNKLLKRRQNAEKLRDENRPLTEVDRLLLKLSDESLRQVETGTLSERELSLAWYVIYDELLQKSLATGKLVRDVPGRFHRLRNIPIIGHLAQGPTTHIDELERRLSGEYSREIRIAGQTEEAVIRQLGELNQLRLAIEQSLYGRGFRDPLFDEVSPTTYPIESRHRIRNEILKHLDGPEGVLTQRYNGRTLLELQQENPVAAAQALHEANNRALLSFAGEVGKSLLKDEKPEADLAKIEAHAVKLEEKPKLEDITPLQETATLRAEELTEVETRLAGLKTKRDAATDGIPALEKVFLEKQASYNKQAPNLNIEITSLATEIAHLQGMLVPAPAGATDAQKVAHAQAMATITENLARVQQNHTAKTDYRNKLIGEYATAEAAFKQTRKESNKLTKEIDDIKKAGGELETKKNTKKAADEAVKNKQEEIEKGSPEKLEQAKALRRWGEVIKNYEKVLGRTFTEDRESEFTREALSDTTLTSDRQVLGAERIRRLILDILPDAELTPEMADKMLSDEAVARAIIWAYQIDTGRSIDAAGNTLNDLFADLEIGKVTLQSFLNPNTRKAWEAAIRDKEIEIVTALLPHLRSSKFQAGDVVRFLIHEGVRSAEVGNPYLAVEERFTRTGPDLRLEPEGVYRPGMGRVEVQNRHVTWEGDITSTNFSREFASELPVHMRIVQDFNRDRVNYGLEIEVDERFLQLLPDNVVGVPPVTPFDREVRRIFYDSNDNLRTEIRARDRLELVRMIRTRDPRILFLLIPRWIQTERGDFQDTPGVGTAEEIALTHFANTIPTTDIYRMLPSATADYLLHRTPAERLRILNGLSVRVPANNVPFTEGPMGPFLARNYEVDFGNDGNFYITDITDPANPRREELNAFYQRRLEAYRQSLGVQTLNRQQRKQLQQEFLQIQEVLGREILKAQQRR